MKAKRLGRPGLFYYGSLTQRGFAINILDKAGDDTKGRKRHGKKHRLF